MNTLQANTPTSRQWPEINEPLRADVIADIGGGLADLWELSPIRIEDNRPRTEEIVDRLYPGNPLLCAGRNRYRFDTKPREAWRGGLTERQFIVPSPMSAVRGKTKEGRWSKHTAANTGPRRFLVCEFDPKEWRDLTSNEQAQYGDEMTYAAAMLDEHAALLSAQAEAGNVKLVRGLWNDPFLRVLENFPAGRHDDDVDALSGAHHVLYDHSNGAWTSEAVRELMRQSERRHSHPRGAVRAPTRQRADGAGVGVFVGTASGPFRGTGRATCRRSATSNRSYAEIEVVWR